jgi:RecQ family ATP-dependent DNA helicase
MGVSDTDLHEQVAEATERLGLHFIFPYQRLVVHSILRTVAFPESEEARPFEIVVLPTGAGKSLCFQLPTVVVPGITVIVFPLLALIADQKRRLDTLGIPAGVLTGGVSREARRAVLADARAGAKDGSLRVLLSNPETLRSREICAALADLPISHLVVDEAHCIIEWGETFRPAYLELEGIIARLNPLRLTAFTATASPQLQARIAARLRPDTPWSAVAGNPDRPNIHYAVMRTPSIDHALTWLLRGGAAPASSAANSNASATDATAAASAPSPASQRRGRPAPDFAPLERPAIVFCPTRDESERTARLLRLRLRDPEIRFYHAGLEREEKTALEQWFFTADHAVLCSTSAYGMGVDKSNIRTVIHRAAPATVESYLQESGRGGRDGEAARAVLLVEEPVRVGWTWWKRVRTRAQAWWAQPPAWWAAARCPGAWRSRGAARAEARGGVRGAAAGADGQGVDCGDVRPAASVAPEGGAVPDAAPNTPPPPLHGYIHTTGCRRRYLLDAMGAEGECTGCDRCDRAVDPCAAEARLVARVLRRPFPMDVDRLPERVAIAGLDRGFTAPPWHRKDLAEVVKARHTAR